jgi:hypothetical protein
MPRGIAGSAALVLAIVASPVHAEPLATVTQSFVGASRFDSGFVPPDSDGAAGPSAFVELVNGAYRVYDKGTGSLLQQSSLDSFWISAGVRPQSFAFDPRVAFDPAAQRWFAAATDNANQTNHVLVAVSNTPDPRQGWKGVSIAADSTGQRWADFPQLGLNRDGVVVSTNLFGVNGGGFSQTEVIAIPKADLLSATPTAMRATVFSGQATSSVPFTSQPALAPSSSGTLPLLSAPFAGSAPFKVTSVDPPIVAPTVNAADRFVSVPPLGPPPPAAQRGSATRIDTLDSRLTSGVAWVGPDLWGVQSVNDNGHAALRWFDVADPLGSPSLKRSGLIALPGMDAYEGSIAVNDRGEIVIGFSASGGESFIGAYAIAGMIIEDFVSFDDPVLLRPGVGPYDVVVEGRNRWGDYSTTSVDPSDPSSFWTIQEWASGPNQWSTDIARLTFAESVPLVEPPTIALVFFGLLCCLVVSRDRSSADLDAPRFIARRSSPRAERI